MQIKLIRQSIWSWQLRYKREVDKHYPHTVWKYWWVDAFKHRICLIVGGEPCANI